MNKVLFLTDHLNPYVGEAVVLQSLIRRLEHKNIDVSVLCLKQDAGFEDLTDVEVLPEVDAEQIWRMCERIQPDRIIATSPKYSDILPHMQRKYACWIWEMGLRGGDCQFQSSMYGRMSGVLWGADMLRVASGYRAGSIVYPSVDHMPHGLPKNLDEVAFGNAKKGAQLLRIGCVVNGLDGGSEGVPVSGEQYTLLIRLMRLAMKEKWPVHCSVLWVGEPQRASFLTDAGIEVVLCTSLTQKYRYLRMLDVYVSFATDAAVDLGLLESQAMGTVGLALDLGANPETTTHVCRSFADAVTLLKRYTSQRDLLVSFGRTSLQYTRAKFSGSAQTSAFLHALYASAPEMWATQRPWLRHGKTILRLTRKTLLSLQRDGMQTTAQKVRTKLLHRVGL